MKCLLTWLLPILFVAELAADPVVIAHRGASGYFPEHTLTAYEAAIAMGADYIEPDLVLTADGHFIALHDIYLGETTNVAEVFPDRTRTIDGKREWYIGDFTLAEVRQLRTRQRFDNRPGEHDGRYPVPTLAEVIDLVKAVPGDRRIGLYPELKAPAYFSAQGFDMGGLLLDSLQRCGIQENVLIQSFDATALKTLSGRTEFPLVMLLYPASRQASNTPNMPLEEVAQFADGVGLSKYLLAGSPTLDTSVISEAKSLGLFVHLWTIRDDLPMPGFDSVHAEIEAYLEAGIDGFFTDFPDSSIVTRDAFLARTGGTTEP
ncbi:MAG: glycerophosphodiester phosphodiesterase family protein [Proteobacteria bacterium]|nr:glycerophosphodiester phosphodiesterase family protein [Pseudomonadota bacterium]